ncbi:MAG: hypothetical protein ACKV2V_05455 [Blastocatellia bacterium]
MIVKESGFYAMSPLDNAAEERQTIIQSIESLPDPFSDPGLSEPVVRGPRFRWLALALIAMLLLTCAAMGVWVWLLHKQRDALAEALRKQQSEIANVSTRVEDMRKATDDLKEDLGQQVSVEQISQERMSLAGENAILKNELDQLSLPRITPSPMDLLPASAMSAVTATPTPAGKKARAAKDNAPVITVAPDDQTFALSLVGAFARPFPEYLIELQDLKTKKVIWKTGRGQAAESVLALTLTRRNIGAGRYKFRVTGVNGKKKEPLDTWDFQVSYPVKPGKPEKR